MRNLLDTTVDMVKGPLCLALNLISKFCKHSTIVRRIIARYMPYLYNQWLSDKNSLAESIIIHPMSNTQSVNGLEECLTEAYTAVGAIKAYKANQIIFQLPTSWLALHNVVRCNHMISVHALSLPCIAGQADFTGDCVTL